MACEQVEFTSSQSGESSVYWYKPAPENLRFYPNPAIGRFEYTNDEDNFATISTPKLTLSPVATTINCKYFHLLLANEASSSIEIWDCCCSDKNNYEFDYNGKLKIKEAKLGNLTVENSGSDLTKVVGDVTYFGLYITFPSVAKIKFIELPTNHEKQAKMYVNATVDFTHEAMTKPVDITATSNNTTDQTQIAVLNGSCGRIFLFSKNQYSFNLLKILLVSNLENVSPFSKLYFDSVSKLWISNYKSDHILNEMFQNNGLSNEVSRLTQFN